VYWRRCLVPALARRGFRLRPYAISGVNFSVAGLRTIDWEQVLWAGGQHFCRSARRLVIAATRHRVQRMVIVKAISDIHIP
jgi:hypothetical protein